jgi:predicted aspartyl protease
MLAVQQAKKYSEEHGLARIAFPVHAMWDTGSTGCCISRSLAEKVGLTSPGTMKLFSGQGDSEVPAYMVDILMADGIAIDDIRVAAVEMRPSYDFIIGMDIIRMGDFALVRDKGSLVFHFNMQ